MKVSQLKGIVREIAISVPPGEEGGEIEVVKVRFRPGSLDLDSLERFETQETELTSIRNLLEPMLVSWDLEDEVLDEEGNPTGEVRPLGTKGKDLGKVPMDFLTQVIEQITDELRPNPPRGVLSEGGSQQMGDLVPLPSGTSSSKQQDTFA